MLPAPDPNMYNTYLFGVTSKNFVSISLALLAVLVAAGFLLWKRVFASKKSDEKKEK